MVSLDDFAVANPISLNQFCYRKKDYPDLLFPEINILAAEDLLFFRMFSHRYKILKSGIITNYVNTHQNRSVNLISPDQFVYWNTFATQYFIENFKLPSNVVRKMKQYLHLFVSNIHLSSGNRKQGFKEMLKVLRYPSTYFNILFYKAVAKLLIH